MPHRKVGGTEMVQATV